MNTPNLKVKDDLIAEIDRMHRVIQDLHDEAHSMARGAHDFEAARLVLGYKTGDFESYVRLTRWLSEAEYSGYDILWVGLLVVTGLRRKRTFWVTNTQGATWNIRDVKKLRLWLIDKGLAVPLADEGKNAYQFKPTQKLLTILQGEVRLSVLK